MSLIPTGNLPRTIHSYKGLTRLQSQAHGKVCPFFAKLTYPNETYELSGFLAQARMDTSQVVPLDAVGVDVYFFWVPLRLIDENFVKMLGDKDPYDETVYGAPTIEVSGFDDLSPTDNSLLDYLGYKVATVDGIQSQSDSQIINAWAVQAYWKIRNDWFRSEILDDSVDLAGVVNAGPVSITSPELTCFTANKKHDYFTDAFTSPFRGDEPLVSLQGLADVAVLQTGLAEGDTVPILSGGGEDPDLGITYLTNEATRPIVADVTTAGFTINQILLAGSLTSQLYNKQMFGTRYTDILRGQWKVTPSDYLLGRSIYLGGFNQTLNNLPVLNTTGDGLGNMAGISATTLSGAQFIQSFEEHGILLGLSVTRLNKHTYSQGFDEALFGVLTELDMYNPDFANIGFMKIKNREIYNDILDDDNEEAFGYAQAWERERVWQNSVAGVFAPMYYDAQYDFADFRSKWCYQDIYESRPYLSSEWLKEDPANVQRTLTGRLIPGAGIVAQKGVNHSYLFKYIMDWKVTRPLGSVSLPRSLGGHL
jgi:hypothetical protein